MVKMSEGLQRQAGKLEAVLSPRVGCVYATRFSQDDQMYRVAVEEIEGDLVTVFFVDFGNREMKVRSELFHLPEKMARWPAAAQPLVLEDNGDAEDSQANRDEVEEVLDKDLEIFFNGGLLERLEAGGRPIQFSFNLKTLSRQNGNKEAKKKTEVETEKSVPKLRRPHHQAVPKEINPGEKLGNLSKTF